LQDNCSKFEIAVKAEMLFKLCMSNNSEGLKRLNSEVAIALVILVRCRRIYGEHNMTTNCSLDLSVTKSGLYGDAVVDAAGGGVETGFSEESFAPSVVLALREESKANKQINTDKYQDISTYSVLSVKDDSECVFASRRHLRQSSHRLTVLCMLAIWDS
jgi:hypothetical protein